MIGPYSMIEVRGPWMLPPPGDVPPRGAISPGSRYARAEWAGVGGWVGVV